MDLMVRNVTDKKARPTVLLIFVIIEEDVHINGVLLESVYNYSTGNKLVHLVIETSKMPVDAFQK
jgi:hypothetical protein